MWTPNTRLADPSLRTSGLESFYFYFFIGACTDELDSAHLRFLVAPSVLFVFTSHSSAAVHPEDQEAEEHGDPHQGDGGGGSEELPVVDAEVPHHGQDHHEHGDHHAAGADGHAHGPQRPGARPRLSPLLRVGLLRGLRDVAVDHAVVGDVQGQQGPLGVLQQLTSVDEFDLMLPTRETFAAKQDVMFILLKTPVQEQTLLLSDTLCRAVK